MNFFQFSLGLLLLSLQPFIAGCESYGPTQYKVAAEPALSRDEATTKLTARLSETMDSSRIKVKTDKPIKILKIDLPEMPKEAMRQAIQGMVTYRIDIDIAGKVEKVTILYSTHPLFSDAVIRAVKQWEFEPATSAGLPTAFSVSHTYKFVQNW